MKPSARPITFALFGKKKTDRENDHGEDRRKFRKDRHACKHAGPDTSLAGNIALVVEQAKRKIDQDGDKNVREKQEAIKKKGRGEKKRRQRKHVTLFPIKPERENNNGTVLMKNLITNQLMRMFEAFGAPDKDPSQRIKWRS